MPARAMVAGLSDHEDAGSVARPAPARAPSAADIGVHGLSGKNELLMVTRSAAACAAETGEKARNAAATMDVRDMKCGPPAAVPGSLACKRPRWQMPPRAPFAALVH